MNPFIPHFTRECLSNLGQDQTYWPTVSKEELIEEELNFVVQINGKKRSILKTKRGMSENEILSQIKLNTKTENFLKNKKIQKTIFVSNRLINIII